MIFTNVKEMAESFEKAFVEAGFYFELRSISVNVCGESRYAYVKKDDVSFEVRFSDHGTGMERFFRESHIYTKHDYDVKDRVDSFSASVVSALEKRKEEVAKYKVFHDSFVEDVFNRIVKKEPKNWARDSLNKVDLDYLKEKLSGIVSATKIRKYLGV